MKEIDREHLANKVGRDAINAVLKDFKNNFPKDIIPYEVEDSWVENKYDAVGQLIGCYLTLRIRCHTYKEINVCRPEVTYWKTGYQTEIIRTLFLTNDLVSDMFANIKTAFIKTLQTHKLYKMDSTELVDTVKKVVKARKESNLLLLL